MNRISVSIDVMIDDGVLNTDGDGRHNDISQSPIRSHSQHVRIIMFPKIIEDTQAEARDICGLQHYVH